MNTLTAAVLVLVLTGCTFIPADRLHQNPCLFGTDSQEENDRCAEKNFGPEGATYIRERAANCPQCEQRDSGGLTPQYCALNCLEQVTQ